MYRLTYDICKINKYMNIRMSFIANDGNKSVAYNRSEPIFNRFKYGGDDYLNISAKPYITIDISNPFVKAEEGKRSTYNPGMRVNLNRYGIFWLTKALKKMQSSFVNIKDLFYYYDGKLTINPEKVKAASLSFKVSNDKVILLKPSIIEDEETRKLHEGILFCINNTDNFCPLKYVEMEYLYYVVEHLNLEAVMAMLMVGDIHTPKQLFTSYTKKDTNQQTNDNSDIMNVPTQ